MKVIAFEGIRGSGKETQARKLAEELENRGLIVNLIEFPRPNTSYGVMLERDKKQKEEVRLSGRVKALLRATDKYSYMDKLLDNSRVPDVVIVDKYVYRDIALSMGTDVTHSWLQSLYQNLPKPDVTFFLEISTSKAEDRLGRKFTDEEIEEIDKISSGYRLISRTSYTRIGTGLFLTVPQDNGITVEKLHSNILKYVLDEVL